MSVDLMDIAVQIVDRREGGYSFEFRKALYQIQLEHLIEHCEWKSPSGRRWRARPSLWRINGEATYRMSPQGDDVYSGGGVRAIDVAESRLDGFDKIWQPIVPDSISRGLSTGT